MSLHAEEQDTLRRFAAETAEKYRSNHEFFSGQSTLAARLDVSAGSASGNASTEAGEEDDFASLEEKEKEKESVSNQTNCEEVTSRTALYEQLLTQCAAEERKLTSTLESTVAASKELQASAAPLSQLEADIRESHRKTLDFRVKVASFVLGVEPTVVVELVKMEVAEEGNDAAAEDADAAQQPQPDAAAEPSQLQGMFAKQKAAAVSQFQEQLKQAANAARKKAAPDVEVPYTVLQAMLYEGEVLSLPVETPKDLQLLSDVKDRIASVVELQSAAAVAERQTQFKAWFKAFGQLTQALGRTRDEVRRHVRNCRKAKEDKKKKDEAEKTKQAVQKASQEAKAAAEKFENEKKAQAPTWAVFEAAHQKLKDKKVKPVTVIEKWDMLTEKPEAWTRPWKMEKPNELMVLWAVPAMAKTLESFATSHKKQKAFFEKGFYQEPMTAKAGDDCFESGEKKSRRQKVEWSGI
eukprot:6492760-Amphidinium_carterae.5